VEEVRGEMKEKGERIVVVYEIDEIDWMINMRG
jgi:hypothetical protein